MADMSARALAAEVMMEVASGVRFSAERTWSSGAKAVFLEALLRLGVE